MSSGAPFIGSKISLISKAEIRYEGVLYQVDTNESTVTLAKVRSYGTEDRQAAKQIPPRNEVYEFIIFRGSDIKDLNVSEMPEEPAATSSPPQDPAILSAQSSAPPTSSVMPPPPPISSHTHHHGGGPAAVYPHYFPPPPHHPHPHPHHQGMANIGGNYSPFGVPYFRPPVMMGAGGPRPVPQGPIPQGHTMPSSHPQATVVTSSGQDALHSGSTNTPPHMLPDSSPSIVATPTFPSVTTETKPQASSTPVLSTAEQTAESAQPSGPPDRKQPPTSENIAHPQRNNPSPSLQNSAPPTSEKKEGHVPAEQRRQQSRSQGQGRETNHRGDHQRSNRGYNKGHRDGGGSHYYSRGRGNGRQQQQHGYSNTPPPSGEKNRPTFKYDSEFDFETANARFKKDSLEQEFKEKLKIDGGGGGTRRGSESTNGEVEGYPSDDEVVEEGELVEEGNEEEEDYYDKSKSFFDNISCEVNSQGNKKASRNEEREVNMETFGVSSVRGSGRNWRWRGRGRGGGRGRGRYNGRGGWRGGRGRGYGGRYRDGGYRGGREGSKEGDGGGNEGGYRRGDRYRRGEGGGYRGGDGDGERGGYRRGGNGDGERGGYRRGDDGDGERGGYRRGGDGDGERGGYRRGGDGDGERGGYRRGGEGGYRGGRQGYYRNSQGRGNIKRTEPEDV